MRPCSAFALLLLASLAACSPGSAPEAGSAAAPGLLAGQDCILIVLDALHADALSCYGGERGTSPRIDALAREGVRAAHVWSPSSWTLTSTASLLTGLPQESHGVSLPSDGLDAKVGTLAAAFASAGYRTAAFVQNPYAGQQHGLDQGFEKVMEDRSGREPPVVGWVLKFLESTAGSPRFVYLHLRRPHVPYDPDAEHFQPFDRGGYQGHVTGAASDVREHNTRQHPLGPADTARLLEYYRGNIHQVDAGVGVLLDGLDRSRTLVVLTSDHGEAFGQHGRFGHNWGIFEEFVSVPLVFAHPALAAGAVIEAPVSTLDVAPTLVELFDLPSLGHELLGDSLASTLLGGPPPRERVVFTSARVSESDGSHDQAVRDARHKLVRHLPDGTLTLYDLQSDTGETVDLSDRLPDTVQGLGRALEVWTRRAEAAAQSAGRAGEADAESLQQLRELGYLQDDG